MRFTRADLPSIALAAFVPAGMFVLLLAAFGLWEHRGTPLLSVLATTVALAGGLAASLTRFVRHWRVVGVLAVLCTLDVGAVIVAQRTGNDWTLLALALKFAGAGLFLAANGAIAWDVIDFGLLPLLDRRVARRAARNTAGA